jgi:hypothetical protein
VGTIDRIPPTSGGTIQPQTPEKPQPEKKKGFWRRIFGGGGGRGGRGG